jgi:hypothetical protein
MNLISAHSILKLHVYINVITIYHCITGDGPVVFMYDDCTNAIIPWRKYVFPYMCVTFAMHTDKPVYVCGLYIYIYKHQYICITLARRNIIIVLVLSL